jgi:hypothetical protein
MDVARAFDDRDAMKKTKLTRKGRAEQGGHPVEGHPKSPQKGQIGFRQLDGGSLGISARVGCV